MGRLIIESTPVLKGKDAEILLMDVKKKPSPKAVKRIERAKKALEQARR
jgi:hypothetical protein